jgi:hypothetical protein
MSFTGRRTLIFVVVLLGIGLLQTSCRKERFLTSGGSVKFSLDTLTFDTVFTSLGSFTTQVKIYNPQNQKITISSVRIANDHGFGSYFHLNVDGVSGNLVENIELAPKDSIYVFATVKIDPTNQNTPFVIEDHLIATLNNKEFSIPVIAYGQNAHYIVDSVLKTQTWDNERPYVIMHNALIDKNETLTILKGCRVYVHADSRLYVLGTLKAKGTKTDSIVFQGDRLDRGYFGYEGYPAEWGGIYFHRTSHDNELDYVIIKNCGGSTGNGFPFAIEVEDSIIQSTPKLIMKHTVIENSIGYGLLTFSAAVYAENCLINTCGAQCIALLQGGTYEFNHCTFVTNSTDKINHIENPVAAILNYFSPDDVNYTVGPLNAIFNNCVIWGSLDNELFIKKHEGADYNLTMSHCLIKNKDGIPSYVTQPDNMLNQDPMFEKSADWDYRPKAGSPLIDKGIALSGITDDLNGNQRTGTPDIGCYEFK